MNNNLQSAQSIANVYLTNFAKSENFWQEFEVAFGNNYNKNIALNIQKNLASKSFMESRLVWDLVGSLVIILVASLRSLLIIRIY